ncbi:penicillin-binding protein activator [Candidatus Woesearchaeota archaeon]|nr:penicillin-binding protein activator [Candidatus Woesearchaeota archaeon]
MKKTTKLAIAIAILIIIVLSGCTQTPAGQVVKEEPIKIGYVGPLTGYTASYGKSQLNALLMAVDEVNEQGGIQGKKIELVIGDSKHLPADSVTIVRKLIDIDNVKAIIGPIGSSNVMAVAPIVNQQQMPLVSPLATSPVVREAGEYVFRTMPDTALQTKKLAQYAQDNNLQRIGVIYVNNDFGAATTQAFEKHFKQTGGEIVQIETHNFAEKDFRTQLTKINNKDVDALFLASYPVESGLILKQAKEMGFNKQIFGVETLGQKQALDVAQESANGIVYAIPKKLTSQDFIEKYNALYKEGMTFATDTAYDGFMLIVESMRECGTEGPQIKECLHKIGQNYQGVSGVITFDAKGDVDKPFALYKIIEGESVEIDLVEDN